jgi:alkylhydroperoxidase family enzyme
LHQRFKDRVQFVAVYVREAHPTDGWRMESNDRAGISLSQPKELLERVGVAQQCCAALEITMPMVVDEMNDRVGHAYSGMPDRLYLLDKNSNVVYKGGRGPFGFKVGELEQAVLLHLLDQPVSAPVTAPAPKLQGCLPILSDDEAWRRLPALEKGTRQPLPTWARALAATMPRTTAAMLELDALHHEHSPLPPGLRAKMRWVAAHANGCVYSEAVAAADLRRAGIVGADIEKLAGEFRGLPDVERAALLFARKLTLAASTVTDAEMTCLRDCYGDWQVVAMVLLVSYANFEDRLFLSLGVAPEASDPPRPLDVRFARDPSLNRHVQAPARKPPDDMARSGPSRITDQEWLARSYSELQQALDLQRERSPRIRVPTWEEVLRGLPPGAPANRPLRIRWSLVCLGYQPELAAGWSACTRAFGEEARQDRVFEESLFWVVTRTLNCFY